MWSLVILASVLGVSYCDYKCLCSYDVEKPVHLTVSVSYNSYKIETVLWRNRMYAHRIKVCTCHYINGFFYLKIEKIKKCV